MQGGQEAGPSTAAASVGGADSVRSMLLQPSSGRASRLSRLSGTSDLLGIFGLVPAYEEHVKAYTRPTLAQPQAAGAAAVKAEEPATNGSGGGIVFKFGGQTLGSPVKAVQQQQQQQSTVKKMEKSYNHLVRDITGKNRIKKDDHIERLVKDPSWFAPARPFAKLDDDALRSAFTLQTGVIPGFDATIWEGNAQDDPAPAGPTSTAQEASPPKRPKNKKKRKQPGSADGSTAAAAPASADSSMPINPHDPKRARKNGPSIMST